MLAGWALERARGDVLNAITLLKSLRTGKWAAERGRQQRAAAIAELRSLTKTYDLTKPVVMRP